ncbi:SDR family oxidoreductase [Hephaestia mangrovi]|uniref:SDR family oxidoreductase n=1 Tax=Hephaestia mangrovi TaxID=2873268 RepID=UPI001CA74404|nr:SDR family oxidoreductase [Hephaestia mangrovi]MBY8829842.1 SDR family oxidoreductase [Hephaestia mangrovi]
MRVFVTGATGWVGSAVVRELIDAGHSVLGLARSEAGAQALTVAGAAVAHGELDDFDSLTSAASQCDGVIHTAFKHDFAQFIENADLDRRVIETIGNVLAGSGRPFITTSGSLMLAIAAPGRVGTERDTPPASIPRVPSEQATVALADQGVRAAVMRLPPSVHGDGDRGFVPRIIDIARATGVSAYIGDRANRWPAVYRPDAARAYRLALENGTAGDRYHAIGDDGIPVRVIAEAIGRRLGLPTVSIPQGDAEAHFGFLARFLILDAPATSDLTRERLGWTPTGPGLIADLDDGNYFAGGLSKFSTSA